ncbi:hypothetical protein RJI07_08305 [Mycoplasmatota bacterium WC30]
MSQKKEKNRIKEERLNDFLAEVSSKGEERVLNEQNKPLEQKNEFAKLAYQCPSCHKLISSRKHPCKHCGYSGYIPISDEQTKKIRMVLFIVILVAAIVVYIVTR